MRNCICGHPFEAHGDRAVSACDAGLGMERLPGASHEGRGIVVYDREFLDTYRTPWGMRIRSQMSYGFCQCKGYVPETRLPVVIAA